MGSTVIHQCTENPIPDKGLLAVVRRIRGVRGFRLRLAVLSGSTDADVIARQAMLAAYRLGHRGGTRCARGSGSSSYKGSCGHQSPQQAAAQPDDHHAGDDRGSAALVSGFAATDPGVLRPRSRINAAPRRHACAGRPRCRMTWMTVFIGWDPHATSYASTGRAPQRNRIPRALPRGRPADPSRHITHRDSSRRRRLARLPPWQESRKVASTRPERPESRRGRGAAAPRGQGPACCVPRERRRVHLRSMRRASRRSRPPTTGQRQRLQAVP
jgi:hypothetical protein